MLCETCGESEATVHVTHVEGGEEREMHVCAACAEQHKLGGLQLNLSDFLVSLEGAESPAVVGDRRERVCPDCHMSLREFRKSPLLGCPSCYTTFRSELLPALAGMQTGVQHIGKTPAAVRVRGDLKALEDRLLQAVQRQAFEEAAGLRDRIASLRSALAGTPEDPIAHEA